MQTMKTSKRRMPTRTMRMRRDLTIAGLCVVGLVLFIRYFCMERVLLDVRPPPALQGR